MAKPSYKFNGGEEDVFANHGRVRRWYCYLQNHHHHAVRNIKRGNRRKERRIDKQRLDNEIDGCDD